MAHVPDPDAHDFECRQIQLTTGDVDVEVVTAIAAVTGEDPVEMEPLYESIDLEAVDRLFAHAAKRNEDSPIAVRFQYGRRSVVITSDGTLRVAKLEA